MKNDVPKSAGSTVRRVVIVTGLSGAGKSSALRAFEDAGFETVDNLPQALISAVVTAGHGPMAIGIDVRTRDFDAARLIETLEQLRRNTKLPIGIVFLDCDNETLGRRFSETRRPHPVADDLPVAVGIETERRLLGPLRESAELLVDTSRMTAAELKRTLTGQYSGTRERPLRVFLTSFGYRYGVPRDADLVFDVRFLKNPHYVPELKPHTGLESDVADFIARDAALAPFLDHLIQLLDPLLPLYEAEGKSYLTIAVGCTGGQHRSVYVVERLKAWLARRGAAFSVRHRDIYATRTPSDI
jgi:UPF0042 nucleotide-binding protein